MRSKEDARRHVRPWIAALLTFLGWGVGFYYARRTKAAWQWALASVFVGVVLAATLLCTALFVRPDIFELVGENGVAVIQLAATIPVAVSAWVLSARQSTVQRGSPARIAGYFAVWLLPVLLSLVLAMGLRFGVMQPFRNPSGSMQPTIETGEYFIVSKWSYGYSRFSAAPLHALLPSGRVWPNEPERGDVAVFRPISQQDRDFVKRIVGLPGDRIQMVDGALHINGEAVTRELLGEVALVDQSGESGQVLVLRETLPNGVSYEVYDRGISELDNTRVFTVPVGSYFVIGDDRDNSADSRVPSIVGYVPFDHLIGRVDRVLRSRSHDRVEPAT